MKTKQLICLLALTMPLTAYADTLSFSIGGGAWHTKPDGTFRKDGDPSNIDVDKELFWNKSTEGYAFAVFEHPVPALPNIKLAYSKISQSGKGDSNYEFDGDVYSGEVKNNFSVHYLLTALSIPEPNIKSDKNGCLYCPVHLLFAMVIY